MQNFTIIFSAHKANNLSQLNHQKTLDFSCTGQKILKPLAKKYSIKERKKDKKNQPKECKY